MKRLFGACLLAIFSTNLPAVEAFAPTQAELSNLPAHCSRRLKGVATPQDNANYPHGHHYCFGLNFVNRAMRSSNQNDRRFNLQSAKGEFGYVIDRIQKSHWLYPQIQTDLGRVLQKLNENGPALNAFNQAVLSNPTYEGAYAGLVEILQKTGDKSSVLEVVTTGLQHIPNSRYLRKIYLESGGKEPFPEPIVGSKDQAPAAASDLGPDTPVSTVDAQPANDENPVGASASKNSVNDTPEAGCRFCPPDEIQQRWRDSFESGAER